MKIFLNSFRNFVFCLKFHLQRFPPPDENFENSPFPLSFLPPPPSLDFEKFQFPPAFVEFKNGGCYV